MIFTEAVLSQQYTQQQLNVILCLRGDCSSSTLLSVANLLLLYEMEERELCIILCKLPMKCTKLSLIRPYQLNFAMMFCLTGTATQYFATLIHKGKLVSVVQYCACTHAPATYHLTVLWLSGLCRIVKIYTLGDGRPCSCGSVQR